MWEELQVKNDRGSIDIFALLFGVASILLVIAIVFAGWAWSGRSDFKNNSDEKAAAAVEAAREDLRVELDAEFAEREKEPFKTYTSPNTFGSVVITYPKTWSAHVQEPLSGQTPINGYFHPGFVPSTSGNENLFALRFEISEQSLDRELASFDGAVNRGDATASAFRSPVDSADNGFRIDGSYATGKNGSVVLLPLRDKTIIIAAESQQFVDDLDSIILENLTYTP